MTKSLQYITILVLSCLCLAFTELKANGEKERLLDSLSHTTQDIKKLKILTQLSELYKEAGVRDSSFLFANRALDISRTLHDTIQMYSLEKLARLHLSYFEVDSAVSLIETLIYLADKSEYYQREINGYNFIGMAYYSISEFEKSLEA